MWAVREAFREWAWFVRLVAGCVLALLSSLVFAQASGVQFSAIVCGPAGLSGVTYASAAGHVIGCGTDSNGDQLELQVSTLVDAGPVEGGEQVGLDIGGAVFLVLAAAFSLRVVRRFIESGSEG